MTQKVYPFPRARGVERDPWLLVANDARAEVDRSIDSWDCATDLTLECTVRIDDDALESSTGLAAGSVVRLVPLWFCERTRTRECLSGHDVVIGAGDVELVTSIAVPGGRVAGSVELELRMILVNRDGASAPYSAHSIGAVLFEDSVELILEGNDPRFPVQWLDFEGTNYPQHAPWVLEWDPEDLEVAVMGGLQLFVNTENAAVRRALEDPGNPDGAAIRDAVRYDVMRQLITGALHNEEFVRNPRSFASETVGACIRNLIRRSFREAPGPLRSRMLSRPSVFEGELKAIARLFGDLR